MLRITIRILLLVEDGDKDLLRVSILRLPCAKVAGQLLLVRLLGGGQIEDRGRLIRPARTRIHDLIAILRIILRVCTEVERLQCLLDHLNRLDTTGLQLLVAAAATCSLIVVQSWCAGMVMGSQLLTTSSTAHSK